MFNINIRIAVESDRDAILKFLRHSFYPQEPLNLALEPFQQADEDEQFLLSCIGYGTCIIAYYNDCNDDYDVCDNHKKQECCTKNNGNNNECFQMNFLNHEARNQHNKEYHCSQDELQRKQQQQNIKCNSNQRNQCNHQQLQQYINNNKEKQKCCNKKNVIRVLDDCSNDNNNSSHRHHHHHHHHHQNTNKMIEKNLQQVNTLNDQNQILNQQIFTKELVSVLIGGPKYPGEAKHLLDESNNVKNLKWSKMLKFLSYIELKSNAFEYFNCESAVHCHGLAVHQNARGKSIGIKMIKEFIKICKNLKYPVNSLDCTSVHSIKLCEKLNMICLYEMKYADYVDEYGEQIFRPPLPHKLIKTFAKRIDDDNDNI